MAEGRLDLPDDLLSSKSPDEPWTGKEASGGNDEDKVFVGLLDDLKGKLFSLNFSIIGS